MQEKSILCRPAVFVLWAVLAVLLACPTVATAQHVPVEFEYSYGWETRIKILDTVTSDSSAAQGAEGKPICVAFKYDRLWLIFPIWTARGEFVLCERPQPGREPARYWPVLPQDPAQISAMTGVDAKKLKRPFFYFAPVSWLVFGAIGAVVISAVAKNWLKTKRRCPECKRQLTNEEGVLRLSVDGGERADLERLSAGKLETLKAFPISNWEEDEQLRVDLRSCPGCSKVNLLTIKAISFVCSGATNVIQDRMISQEQVDWIRELGRDTVSEEAEAD